MAKILFVLTEMGDIVPGFDGGDGDGFGKVIDWPFPLPPQAGQDVTPFLTEHGCTSTTITVTYREFIYFPSYMCVEIHMTGDEWSSNTEYYARLIRMIREHGWQVATCAGLHHKSLKPLYDEIDTETTARHAIHACYANEEASRGYNPPLTNDQLLVYWTEKGYDIYGNKL